MADASKAATRKADLRPRIDLPRLVRVDKSPSKDRQQQPRRRRSRKDDRSSLRLRTRSRHRRRCAESTPKRKGESGPPRNGIAAQARKPRNALCLKPRADTEDRSFSESPARPPSPVRPAAAVEKDFRRNAAGAVSDAEDKPAQDADAVSSHRNVRFQVVDGKVKKRVRRRRRPDEKQTEPDGPAAEEPPEELADGQGDSKGHRKRKRRREGQPESADARPSGPEADGKKAKKRRAKAAEDGGHDDMSARFNKLLLKSKALKKARKVRHSTAEFSAAQPGGQNRASSPSLVRGGTIQPVPAERGDVAPSPNPVAAKPSKGFAKKASAPRPPPALLQAGGSPQPAADSDHEDTGSWPYKGAIHSPNSPSPSPCPPSPPQRTGEFGVAWQQPAHSSPHFRPPVPGWPGAPPAGHWAPHPAMPFQLRGQAVQAMPPGHWMLGPPHAGMPYAMHRQVMMGPPPPGPPPPVGLAATGIPPVPATGSVSGQTPTAPGAWVPPKQAPASLNEAATMAPQPTASQAVASQAAPAVDGTLGSGACTAPEPGSGQQTVPSAPTPPAAAPEPTDGADTVDLYGDLRLDTLSAEQPQMPPADTETPGNPGVPGTLEVPSRPGTSTGAPLMLDSLLGSWRDSRGHTVQVSWARAGNRGGQLDVELRSQSRTSIKLNVKDLGNGHFSCGHFDLDTEKSNLCRIVWVDLRTRGQTCVWER